MRRYSINEDFFEVINSEEKAYFLGLLFADGYHYEKKNRIVLNLHQKDIELLLKFKEVLSAENPITYDRNGRILSFASKKMSQDLIKLGLLQRKTLTCRFPDVRTDLIRHFIRGYFDGDGCATIQKERGLNCSLLGNKLFLQELVNKFPFKIQAKIHQRSSIYEFKTGGKETLFLMYEWMYNNSTIFLRRKQEKWKLGLESCEEKTLEENRMIRCPQCGLHIDRDVNAARNILARGMQFVPDGGTSEAMVTVQRCPVDVPQLEVAV